MQRFRDQDERWIAGRMRLMVRNVEGGWRAQS
jgi:hypothetical protein